MIVESGPVDQNLDQPGQVAALLFVDLVYLEVRKDHAALGMVGVRQGIEPLRN